MLRSWRNQAPQIELGLGGLDLDRGDLATMLGLFDFEDRRGGLQSVFVEFLLTGGILSDKQRGSGGL